MIYRLVDILEDIDFGCEEREGSRPLMAVAVLEDTDKNQNEFKLQLSEVIFPVYQSAKSCGFRSWEYSHE